MDGCRAVVVAEKYAAEIEAVRDELPDLEHVLVRDSEYEAWLARQSAVDPDPAIAAEDYFIIRHIGGTTGGRNAWLACPIRRIHMRLTCAANAPPTCSAISGIETALKAYEIFGNAMYQGYGQTELLPVAMLEPPQWVAKDVPGSQPLHAELQISDENNRLPSASSMAE